MAQKINPINFRSLKVFEDFTCLQTFYGYTLRSYLLRENLTVSSFIHLFLQHFGLVLHSFKYVKTSRGIAHLNIKYIFSGVSIKKKVGQIKLPLRFATLEKAFFFGFLRFLPKTVLRISFFNLSKKKLKIESPFSVKINTLFFSTNELSFYLKALLSIRGGAFFLARIVAIKLNNMRSRSDRKTQKKFLLFVKLLLLHILKFNVVKIKGLRISVKGRINGIPRSKLWCISKGTISLQKISSKIDYFYVPSYTVYGTFGIKVWINYVN